MRTKQIQIGGVYTAKVTGRVVPIRIDAINDEGGWDGTNLATGKAVRVPTPRRLRREVTRAELKSGKAPGIDRKPLHGAKAGVKRPSKNKTAEAKSMSALDAARQVLLESTEPLRAKEIVRLAAEAGYWHSDAKTPHATVYAAILREIREKGTDARFTKAAPGKFRATGGQ